MIVPSFTKFYEMVISIKVFSFQIFEMEMIGLIRCSIECTNT